MNQESGEQALHNKTEEGKEENNTPLEDLKKSPEYVQSDPIKATHNEEDVKQKIAEIKEDIKIANHDGSEQEEGEIDPTQFLNNIIEAIKAGDIKTLMNFMPMVQGMGEDTLVNFAESISFFKESQPKSHWWQRNTKEENIIEQVQEGIAKRMLSLINEQNFSTKEERNNLPITKKFLKTGYIEVNP